MPRLPSRVAELELAAVVRQIVVHHVKRIFFLLGGDSPVWVCMLHAWWVEGTLPAVRAVNDDVPIRRPGWELGARH